jgi:hypothetical protein
MKIHGNVLKTQTQTYTEQETEFNKHKQNKQGKGGIKFSQTQQYVKFIRSLSH